MTDVHNALYVVPPVVGVGLIGFAVLGPRREPARVPDLVVEPALPPDVVHGATPSNVALVSKRLLARRALAGGHEVVADPVPSVQDILLRSPVADSEARAAHAAESVVENAILAETFASVARSDVTEPNAAVHVGEREIIRGHSLVTHDPDVTVGESAPSPPRRVVARLRNALAVIQERFVRRARDKDASVDHADASAIADLGPEDAAILEEASAGSESAPAAANAKELEQSSAVQTSADPGGGVNDLLFPIVPDEMAPTRPIVVASPVSDALAGDAPPVAAKADVMPLPDHPTSIEAVARTEAIELQVRDEVPPRIAADERLVEQPRVTTWFERLAPGRDGASDADRAIVARSLGDIRLGWAADLIEGAFASEVASVQTAFVYAMGAGQHVERSAFFYRALESDALDVRLAALDVVAAFHSASVAWSVDALRALLFDLQTGPIAAVALAGDHGDMRAVVEPIVGAAAADVLLQKAALFV